MEQWPTHVDQLRERADELDRAQRYEEALDLRRQIMRAVVEPGALSCQAESDAACALVWSLTTTQHYDECLVVGTRALGRLRLGDDAEPDLCYHQALSAAQLGFLGDAATLYERAITSGEQYPTAAPLVHDGRLRLVEL